ncbi:unknown protein [Simkania negevensis Z]|uniref:Uncharacterized protein n=1 Tax=Simkania negevensis (strain ATCC VR-1471 / DSM 27360 / Z) TaxID=331113 RepID=F8L730_SIMNZ|nr:unknown protein [Simkania negevensis Z]
MRFLALGHLKAGKSKQQVTEIDGGTAIY